MPLFYFNFRNTDRRSVVIIEAEALVAARMKAALAGLDRELEFDSGLELDEASSRQIPKEMIGRLLDDRDLRRLQRSIVPKKPRKVGERRRSSSASRTRKIASKGGNLSDEKTPTTPSSTTRRGSVACTVRCCRRA